MANSPQKPQESPSSGAHNSSSPLWMVAGIPALLIIAFLAYRGLAEKSPVDVDGADSAMESSEVDSQPGAK